ncbi:unnamed protein product [Cyprideis torosa]|uniref:Uncharacterized protein n=1 Tax=Cyprideis torosa TaxID=163714 RepID=A0A7R8W2R0_9CRUS|nr:unnamed protein product [Cyprideis torosa]CAG0882198.1 unnamed protein product [Cyprideis torosa]
MGSRSKVLFAFYGHALNQCSKQMRCTVLSSSGFFKTSSYSTSSGGVRVVDLKKCEKEGGDAATARAIDTGFRELGFACLTNHGIPPHVLENAFVQCKEFFENTPTEQKQLFSRSADVIQGYSSIGQEDLTEKDGLREFKESLDFQVFDTSDPKHLINIPDGGLFLTMKELRDHLHTLALKLLGLLEISLQVEPNVLISKHSLCGTTENATALRSLFYPAVEKLPVGEKLIRCAPHSDYGTMTLLLQDDEGGLEIWCDRTQQWVPAHPVQGSVLVNIGDLTEIWCGGTLKATQHRVLITPSAVKSPRQSIAYFVHPDRSVVVQPLTGDLDWYQSLESLPFFCLVELRLRLAMLSARLVLQGLKASPVLKAPSYLRGHALPGRPQIRVYSEQSRGQFSRRAQSKTLKERAMAPAGEGAFQAGQMALAAGSGIGLAALAYYGLGLSKSVGAADRAQLWPEYVKERIQTTYMYFGGSLIFTGGAAVAAFRSPTLMNLMAGNSWMVILGTMAAMIGTSILCQSIPYTPGVGPKQMAWMLHTSTIGVVIAPLCILGGPILTRAALYTAGVVGGLSVIAACAPSDKFLSWGGPMAIGLGVVFAASLGSMFLPPTTALGAGLYSISLYGGLLLFSAFLLYDTQKIIMRAETLPPNVTYDPVNNSMSIYMDTINIFIRIATILAGGGSNRKR